MVVLAAAGGGGEERGNDSLGGGHKSQYGVCLVRNWVQGDDIVGNARIGMCMWSLLMFFFCFCFDLIHLITEQQRLNCIDG